MIQVFQTTTIIREGKLQRFLRDLKKKDQLDQEVAINLSGWQPARIYMYGPPKMHKPWAANAMSPFRLISSSIGTIWPNFWVPVICCSRTFPLNNYVASDSFYIILFVKLLAYPWRGSLWYHLTWKVSLPTLPWMNAETWRSITSPMETLA